MIKEALVTCGPTFTTARMLDDYVTRIYTRRHARPVHAQAGDGLRTG